MKYFTFFIIFISINFFQCTKTKQQKFDELNALINDIIKLEKQQSEFMPEKLKVGLTDSASLFILKYMSNEVLFDNRGYLEELIASYNDNDGYPIESADYNRLERSHPLVNNKGTEWVFFYKEDLDDLFSSGNCKGQKGVKIYLKKYPNDFKRTGRDTMHRYKGLNTVALWATCDGVNIDTHFFKRALYDFGDVCPPNCNVSCSYSSRQAATFGADYIKDGLPCPEK